MKKGKTSGKSKVLKSNVLTIEQRVQVNDSDIKDYRAHRKENELCQFRSQGSEYKAFLPLQQVIVKIWLRTQERRQLPLRKGGMYKVSSKSSWKMHITKN